MICSLERVMNDTDGLTLIVLIDAVVVACGIFEVIDDCCKLVICSWLAFDVCCEGSVSLNCYSL